VSDGVARILIWSLADSKTTLEELREHLPLLGEESAWIANEPQERFGLVTLSDELPDLGAIRELIGKEPEVAEEYDVL
jgi:hypothetical protein